MIHILDVNDIKLKNNLQDNLKFIGAKYGNKFILKNNQIKLKISFILTHPKYNPDLKFYSLTYNEKRYSSMYPINIQFINKKSLKLDDTCYIANLHKTDKYTGSDILNTILLFLKNINAKTVYLEDYAHLNCTNSNGSVSAIDLSFYKLIEKGTTFYQKFGFILDLDDNKFNFKDPNKTITLLLNLFKKITVSTIIQIYEKILNMLKNIIDKKDYNGVTIYMYPDVPYELIKNKNESKVESLFQEIVLLLDNLNKSNKKYLYQALIDFMNEDCNIYYIFEDLMFNNMFYGIKYNRKSIFLKHMYIFDYLRLAKSGIYKLTF